MGEPSAIRNVSLYREDFFLWTQEQAKLLQERRFDEIDLDHLVDEVKSVGRSERSEIENRLVVLVAHLLKWRLQPGHRSSGWRGTIAEQRRRLARALEASPSLRDYPAEVFRDFAYLSARLEAAKDTGIDFTLFPETPPFTVGQALDEGFLPKEPDLCDQS